MGESIWDMLDDPQKIARVTEENVQKAIDEHHAQGEETYHSDSGGGLYSLDASGNKKYIKTSMQNDNDIQVERG